jgi:CheY-like chemotaxis protein
MLTAILGNVAFAAGLDSLEEARPLLDEIRVAAERSAALTAQLLAFARRQVIEPKVLAPAELIRRLEPLLRRLLDERRKLELSLPARGSVCVGESQLEQVVMNLVTNARDAVSAGGRVRVETRDVSLDAALADEFELAPGEYVMIAVSDDGCGIMPEALPHLFEPFFTTRERGTGLGLATCYGIVKQSGGAIRVESKPGAGSTFRVYLPVVSGAVDPANTAAAAPASAAIEKVLVVEDEENVRRVLERSLRRGEFAVYVAGDAAEALRIADQDGPFDVLVTDVVMPDVDGPELALRLRKRWPRLRVLFVSGYTHELPAKEAGDAATEFLPKPFRPADVLNAVRRLCGTD